MFFKAFKFYFYNHFVSNIPSFRIRQYYLRRILKYEIGNYSTIHMGCFFTGDIFIIKNNSTINRGCYLDCRGGLEIGENVSISPGCYILSEEHDPQSSDFKPRAKKTCIKNYAWIGAKSVVLPGKTIEEGAILAAGAILTKNIPPYKIYGGNPAKEIGDRTKNLDYKIYWKSYFDTDIRKVDRLFLKLEKDKEN